MLSEHWGIIRPVKNRRPSLPLRCFFDAWKESIVYKNGNIIFCGYSIRIIFILMLLHTPDQDRCNTTDA